MAWYDNGIQFKNDSLPMSGQTHKVSIWDCMDNCVAFNSISLQEGADGGEYSILLGTTGGGTQIYYKIHRQYGIIQDLYNPRETNVPSCTYWGHVYLKKGASELHFIASGLGYSVATTQRGVNNMWETNVSRRMENYYDTNGHLNTNTSPFPRGATSARNNIQICANIVNNEICIYVIGANVIMQTSPTPLLLNNPVYKIGHISESALNSGFWFDPIEDGLAKNQTGSSIGGGRTVDSTYNGQDIGFPELPTGASALGFSAMTMYKPTAQQLDSAMDIIYTDSDEESTLEQIIESAKKWWYKPQQYCVSLMLTPVNVSTSGSKTIKFGKYDSEVTSAVVSNQWQIVDCGTLSVPLMYGNYLDFTMVRAMIYLPYVGFRAINVNEIMGGNIAIKYYIDIFTGNGVCFIRCNNENSNNSILYTYECNVNTQVPITSNDYSNVISNLLKSSVAVATAPIGGAIAVGGAVATGVNAIESAKDFVTPNIQTSGALTPNTGVLGHPKPYVVLHFPVSLEEQGQTTLQGKISNSAVSVGDLKGYNSFKEIHLDGVALPSEILKQVENQFKSGVII